MSKYLIAIEPEFFPQYDELPKEIKKKFKKQLSYLKDNPKHNSLQIHKLEGTDFWEFYVDKSSFLFETSNALNLISWAS